MFEQFKYTKIFVDTADLNEVLRYCREPWAKGFTTNPTLMRQAEVTDYRLFVEQFQQLVPDLPISFEVVADDLNTMARQARTLAEWAPGAYIKIPITLCDGTSTLPLIQDLAQHRAVR